jgi:hypothetical protein
MMRAPACKPAQVVDVARFTKTAGAIDFNWGANTGAPLHACFHSSSSSSTCKLAV